MSSAAARPAAPATTTPSSRLTGRAYDLDHGLVRLELKLAQLTATGNPGIVQVHAVYEDKAWTHMVMDLNAGSDLLHHGALVPEPDVATLAE